MFRKQPSRIEVYNDVDEDLVNLFRVIRDKKLHKKLKRKLKYSFSSKADNRYYRNVLINKRKDYLLLNEVDRAFIYFFVLNTSFNGQVSAGYSDSNKRAYKNYKSSISFYAKRLEAVRVECTDWKKCVDRYDSEKTLFYFDPPYLSAVRSSPGRGYENEFQKEKDHVSLCRRLLKFKGMSIISGKISVIYYLFLERNGFKRIDFDTYISAIRLGPGAKGEKTVESIWLSPNIKHEGLFG